MTERLIVSAAIGYIAGTLLGALRDPWRKWRYQRRCRRAFARFADPRLGVPFDEGRVQRGNGSGSPTTPKPNIIPKPQFPPPRKIREDFLP